LNINNLAMIKLGASMVVCTVGVWLLVCACVCLCVPKATMQAHALPHSYAQP